MKKNIIIGFLALSTVAYADPPCPTFSLEFSMYGVENSNLNIVYPLQFQIETRVVMPDSIWTCTVHEGKKSKTNFAKELTCALKNGNMILAQVSTSVVCGGSIISDSNYIALRENFSTINEPDDDGRTFRLELNCHR